MARGSRFPQAFFLTSPAKSKKMPLPASAMRNFFRRAAPYGAGAMLIATLPFALKPKPPAGHLGLVRARPGLEGLGAALTRKAFLFDAAYALAAGVCRVPVLTAGLLLRSGAGSIVSQRAAVVESGGDAERAARYRLVLALLEASDGRVEEALHSVAGLARERTADPEPRLAAGALCYLLGRAGDGRKWLDGIPEAARRGNGCLSQEAAVTFPTGGKGVDKLLAWPASRLREAAVLSALESCDLSVEEALEISMFAALLRRSFSGASEAVLCPGGSGKDPATAMKMFEIFAVEYCRLALSVLLRTKPPSSGARTDEVLAEAERELARVEAEGDAGAAADVNLLLALATARDGHFDEALGRYAQAALADPSDLRPYMLAAKLCRLTGRVGELGEWRVRAQRLRPLHEHVAAVDEAELGKLLDELAVAVALGHGALTASGSGERGAVMLAAWREVDAGTAAQLHSKELPLDLEQRLLIMALRLLLRIKLKPVLSADPDIQEMLRCSSSRSIQLWSA